MRRTHLPCLLLPLLAACRIHGHDWDHEDERTISGLVPIEGPLELLRIDLDVADLKVVPGTAGQLRWHGRCRVEYDDREVLQDAPWRLELRETEGVAELTHRERGDLPRHQLSFRLTIEVPPEAPLEVRVGVGDVELRNQHRSLRVAAGVGDVRVVGCRGQARLRSGVGDVRAVRHDGPVDAESGVGDVNVELRDGSAGHDLRLHSGVGDVDLWLSREQGELLSDGSGRQQRARSTGAGESYSGRLGRDGPRIDASAGTGEVSIRSR